MTKPSLWQLGLILSIGVLAVSTSAILIRLSIEAAKMRGVGFSLFLAASRLTLAAIVLVPTWRNFTKIQVVVKAYYYAITAGICLALHFASWITSLSFTSIAASTTIVTTNPIWVALLSWFWLKQKISKITAIGITIALAGGITIALGDRNIHTQANNPLLGDVLALVGAWMASLYILFGSKAQRLGLEITNYIAIAYTTAALFLLPFPFLLGTVHLDYPQPVYLYILLMALLPQLIGHTSFNWAIRYLSPTLITLVILFEPIGSSCLGLLLFKEIPSPSVIIGGSIVLLGVATAVIGERKEG